MLVEKYPKVSWYVITAIIFFVLNQVTFFLGHTATMLMTWSVREGRTRQLEIATDHGNTLSDFRTVTATGLS